MEIELPCSAGQLAAIASSIDLDDNHIELVLQTKRAGEVTIKFPRTTPYYATIMYASFAMTAQLECVQGVLAQSGITDEVTGGVIKLILIGLEVDQRPIINNNNNVQNSSSCHGGGKTIDFSQPSNKS